MGAVRETAVENKEKDTMETEKTKHETNNEEGNPKANVTGWGDIPFRRRLLYRSTSS